jgi:hypothetical protein
LISALRRAMAKRWSSGVALKYVILVNYFLIRRTILLLFPKPSPPEFRCFGVVLRNPPEFRFRSVGRP